MKALQIYRSFCILKLTENEIAMKDGIHLGLGLLSSPTLVEVTQLLSLLGYLRQKGNSRNKEWEIGVFA